MFSNARKFFKHFSRNVKEKVSSIKAQDVGKEVFAIVGIVGCCHLFGQYVLSYSICVGPSMAPTLNSSGDFVLVLPSIYRLSFSEYKIGDVILATCPTDPTKIICKRIRGLSGDIILTYPTDSLVPSINLVPVGYCWLAGDNPRNSTDSRMYGPVPLGLIRGKVICKIKPTSPPFIHPIAPQPPSVIDPDETSPLVKRQLSSKYVRAEENEKLCEYTEENQKVKGSEAMMLKRAIYHYVYKGELPESIGRRIVDRLVEKEEEESLVSSISRMITSSNNQQAAHQADHNNNNNNHQQANSTMIVIDHVEQKSAVEQSEKKQ